MHAPGRNGCERPQGASETTYDRLARHLQSLQADIRCDQVFADKARDRPARTVSGTTTDQVWVTTSGFFSLPPLMALLMTFGSDRVLFSVDYPFSPNAKGTEFLRALPISETDRIKLAHGNADRLLGLRSP